MYTDQLCSGRSNCVPAGLMRIGMDNKNADGGNKPKHMRKKRTGKAPKLSEYAASQLPKGAVLDFIFYEDFDNDSQKEAVIGVTRFTPFPPDSAVLIVRRSKHGEFEHKWFTLQNGLREPEEAGIIDSTAAADTDGDGSPELIISRVLSHEHDIDISVIDWKDGNAFHAWHSGRSFFHGSMEVADADGDGIAEIIAEYGTRAGHEIISMDEACYHVRESLMFKWDGRSYCAKPYSVKMPYISYNAAVDFMRSILLHKYEDAYSMVMIPPFLGLSGLDDSSLPAFRSYIEKKVLPVLCRNLVKGKLVPVEPYDTCCHFAGPEDDFTFELMRTCGGVKISGLVISKRHRH